MQHSHSYVQCNQYPSDWARGVPSGLRWEYLLCRTELQGSALRENGDDTRDSKLPTLGRRMSCKDTADAARPIRLAELIHDSAHMMAVLGRLVIESETASSDMLLSATLLRHSPGELL